MGIAPTLLWLRRDLRLSDHPALDAAITRGGPVIPVVIRDGLVQSLGAAPKWRLGEGLRVFGEALDGAGSTLILRTGNALDMLRELAHETGAEAVYWTRAYDPASITRDTDVKSALKQDGMDAQSFGGHLLFEPWSVETQTGGYYNVYTPYWKSVRSREVDMSLGAPSDIPAPQSWPASEMLDDWALGAAMRRGDPIVAKHAQVGESAARTRLHTFIGSIVAGYHETRDLPATDGTSRLSQNLALGEISPRACWHAGKRAMQEGKAGAETFLKELVWREFAYHLMYHTPRIVDQNWKEGWDSFAWNEDEQLAEVKAWKQGRTGIAFVDAAMREMYVTGTMHNRGRMIVASYLTKHLMCHWRIGQKWFEDCLIDWDPAANAMGWQWAAGSGPDAAPYFRVFNPETQLEKFDKTGDYRAAWIAEDYDQPADTALDYFKAIPARWHMAPDDPYPAPIVSAAEGRKRALEAYAGR